MEVIKIDVQKDEKTNRLESQFFEGNWKIVNFREPEAGDLPTKRGREDQQAEMLKMKSKSSKIFSSLFTLAIFASLTG